MESAKQIPKMSKSLTAYRFFLFQIMRLNFALLLRQIDWEISNCYADAVF